MISKCTKSLYFRRGFASDCMGIGRKGLVLGAYDGCSEKELKLTPTADKFDIETDGKLKNLLKEGAGIRKGTAKVFSNIHPDFGSVAVAGLGQEGVGYNENELLDMCKENIRWASGLGAAALQDEGVTNIFVESFSNSEAAAEGANLATWTYRAFKKKEDIPPTTKLEPYEVIDKDGWMRGMLKADCQNLARRLEETPSNLMTPENFCGYATDLLTPCGVQVDLREKDWLEHKKWQSFLAVARGSCEDPYLLELGYCGSNPDDKPVTFVGKGVTFDTGGLCLKNCAGMSEYRGDLAGAAVIVAVIKCIATMALPINVRAVIPLCENMLGGLAVHPGDVYISTKGVSVAVEDTDNEGRVILLDALNFVNIYSPCMVLSIASLTNGIRKAMGAACSGVFSTSDAVWRELNRAGTETGDRVWRFPFWKYFKDMVTDYKDVDVNNVGRGAGGSPCLGAAFLREFAPPVDFVHLDITGTGLWSAGVGFPYLREGIMTGRPTRTIIQFLYQIACPHDKSEDC